LKLKLQNNTTPTNSTSPRSSHDGSQRYIPQTNLNPSPSNVYPQQSVNEQQQQHHQASVNQSQRHSDPLGGMSKDKMLNFGDLAKATPPFKDFFNNLHTYQYLQQLEQASDAMQPRHTQITQQYSSSTDEGCDTDDHGGEL
jgi:hypothetical protein